tara:strand:- start:17699 stop:19795 length:2097 start_codon:yes stop_codon:yes gene_type:complete
MYPQNKTKPETHRSRLNPHTKLHMTDLKPKNDKTPPSDPKKNPQGKPTPPPPQKSRGAFGFIVVMLMVFMLAMFLSSAQQGRQITFQQFEQFYQNKKVKLDSVVLSDSGLTAKLVDSEAQEGESTSVRVPITAISREVIADRVYELTDGRVIEKPTSSLVIFLYSVGPILIILLVIWFLLSRSMRGAAGGGGMLGSFGKSKHRAMTKEMTGVTFKDVAGIEEAKDEVSEIIEFLKTPKKFTKLGGRIPRGVLLAGQPGCGKTLLAKAIAGEADVPFFSISGSDFVEMFVGVGASRVRDLFKQAKESAPCIIFLDEIDAVGRRRGGGFTTGGHDEREQTLNAILVEMDGFESGDGVIVIAATNRPDVLDPALIRPGRFDRQISVSLPDVKGRLEILKVHAKKVKLGPNVDLSKLARGTPMFSGADLAAIINEAAIGATMQNKDFIEHEDLEEARDKVKFGRAKKSRVREKDENKLVAYHEAGHAVLQALLKDADPLHKVTIIPRGASGGATFSLPEKDRMGYSLKWLKATMRVICGGRIAESKAMDDISSGASSDIQQVTRLARAMILEWGMSPRLGFVNYHGQDSAEGYIPDKDYSDETAKIIDEETKRIVDESYAHAESMIDDNWDKVEAVAQALLKYENMTAEEVHSIMRGEPIGRSTVAELLAAETPAPSSNGKGSGPKKSESTDTPPDTLPSPA